MHEDAESTDPFIIPYIDELQQNTYDLIDLTNEMYQQCDCMEVNPFYTDARNELCSDTFKPIFYTSCFEGLAVFIYLLAHLARPVYKMNDSSGEPGQHLLGEPEELPEDDDDDAEEIEGEGEEKLQFNQGGGWQAIADNRPFYPNPSAPASLEGAVQ
eukprot:TRINITY_DN8386_c0_g1_i3.p1 TRINITY_DN8386_c0_g1~~TRINITY_DN8386_c0_g1_i3.p1  ORF type:complete len:157 (-),score=25.17 TRINITY_DN8386_c0_g1_i3:339-809(-)